LYQPPAYHINTPFVRNCSDSWGGDAGGVRTQAFGPQAVVLPYVGAPTSRVPIGGDTGDADVTPPNSEQIRSYLPAMVAP